MAGQHLVDVAALSAEDVHNALHSMTRAYGGALADKTRIINILRRQLDQLGATLEATRTLLEEARRQVRDLNHEAADREEFVERARRLVALLATKHERGAADAMADEAGLQFNSEGMLEPRDGQD